MHPAPPGRAGPGLRAHFPPRSRDTDGRFEAMLCAGAIGGDARGVAARGPRGGSTGVRLLTFDLEDWFHLLQWRCVESEDSWAGFESRFEHATDRILETLDRHGVTATFFSLGWIARRYPHVLRHIDALGHDFGTHGHAHRLLSDLRPAEFEADLVDSLHAIEDAIGRGVRAYRAPGFSLTPRTTWAVDILLDHGIEVDSSVFASHRSHGGWPGGPDGPCWLRSGSGRLRELPVTPGWWAGLPVPYSGGGYFRLLPYGMSRRLMRQQAYAMTYFHPRDFDAEQPRLPRMGPVRRFRAYVGLRTALDKLDRLLTDFDFVNVGTAIERIPWADVPTVDVERPVHAAEPRAAGEAAPARREVGVPSRAAAVADVEIEVEPGTSGAAPGSVWNGRAGTGGGSRR